MSNNEDDLYKRERDALIKKFFEAIDASDVFSLTTIINEHKLPFWEINDENGCSGIIKSSFLNLTEITIFLIEEAKKRILKKGEMELKNWINHKGENGFNALHYAAFRGNVKIIEKLIENGAELTIRNNNGLNVMHMAAQGDQPNALVYFKEKYDMKINSLDHVMSTPLHWACYMGSESAVDYLISWKADINIKDKDGFTPLHLAVMTGKNSYIKIFNLIRETKNYKKTHKAWC